MDIAKNIETIKQEIAANAVFYGRKKDEVTLLAASKSRSIEAISAAFHAGQRAFGENFVQEAIKKIMAFDAADIEWHFIGGIQKNKTKKIAEHFHWVHSVSSPEIAERLNAQRPSHLPPLNICLEINVSHETSKAGINYVDVLPLAELCMSLPQLSLRGLMAIPAPKKQFIDQRAEFYKLRLLFDELNAKHFKLDTLSMGMSNDMHAAIAEGSTVVRIGTAIFGGRVLKR